MFLKNSLVRIVFISLLVCMFNGTAIAQNTIYLPKVINGDIVPYESYPFMGVLYFDRKSPLCTGTIIGDRWVLTASHCVLDGFDELHLLDADDFTFVLGEQSIVDRHSNVPKKNARTLKVEKIFLYDSKNYENDLFNYDIALLKLKESAQVKPLALPQSPNEFPQLKMHQPTVALGYGISSLHFNPIDPFFCKNVSPCYSVELGVDNFLHLGNEITLSDAEGEDRLNLCKKDGDVSEDVQFNPVTTLAVYSPQGTKVHYGDSGGPLLIETGRGLVEIGVTSWGPIFHQWGITEQKKERILEHLKEQPTYFVDLLNADILKFIYSTMGNN